MSAEAESSELFGDVDVPNSALDMLGIDAIYPLPVDCNIPGSVSS